VIDSDAALSHHFFQIPETQAVTQIHQTHSKITKGSKCRPLNIVHLWSHRRRKRTKLPKGLRQFRIGTNRQEKLEESPPEIEAGQALGL
jgi:hypothetical protein